MHIAIITAGGAGMFCGSCMHDNTWARALMAAGAEVSLIPTYTPIRVDEQNHSTSRVFFGGINVYMEYRSRLYRSLPRVLTRWLDTPWLLNLASRLRVSNDAKDLGELTLAMLDGEAGPQSRDIDELVEFLAKQLKPDVICFSNALLVGTLRQLRERFPGKIFCTLQGDDIFLEELPEPIRSQALGKIRERAAQFDGFFVHSRYYRDFMSGYFDLPASRFHVLPLGIDFDGHHLTPPPADDGRPFTVGYFARICPEKGLHQLVEAFRILHGRHPEARLVCGGYLGPRDEKYFRQTQHQARDLGEAFTHLGSPDTLAEKVSLLRSLDVLSVPTVYHEPKGLYVLEALANGIPVVQPGHGSFPELIEATGGGLIVPPGDPKLLAEALEQLLLDPQLRRELGRQGQEQVRKRFSGELMAAETLQLLADFPAAEPSASSC
ncbi:MAG: glycosyltransferase family 4 protein [Planctomycetaceae bacterium]|nr:glycosyltransferase family 4 protein [Planctomycetaceae bacterium]